MEQLTWKDITVKRIQAVLKAATDISISDIDKTINIISALYNMPAEQVEQMPLDSFNELSAKANAFSNSLPIGKPVRSFKVHNRRYRIIYNLTKLTIGQRRKLQRLATDDNLQNLHLHMACIVEPVNWWGKKKEVEYDVIVQDMLDAPAIHAVTAYNYFNELYVRMQTYN